MKAWYIKLWLQLDILTSDTNDILKETWQKGENQLEIKIKSVLLFNFQSSPLH